MPTEKSPVDEIKAKAIEADVIEAIRTIFDPELPVNIYDLGLIYGIDVAPDGVVSVRMTLTAPTCPVAESLPPAVEVKVKSVASVTDAKVELVWDPPWTPERMSEAARLELNFDVAPSPSKFFNVDLPPR
ncbi:MAG: DUF59 domain-containing protein [Planctomycetes bacterium]|nr:DUF59 domain-containing protein [Planctomycetota bacterium]